jgi:plastocyanin
VSVRKLVTVSVAVMVVVAVGACGSNNKVGNKALVNFKDQTQQRLGVTTTAAPGPATTAAGGGGHLGIGGSPTTSAAPRVATTQATAAPQQSFEIDVNGDNSSTTQFDPPAARVYVGTLVRFVNKDTVVRSVAADSGAFASGPIAPGGSWTYKPAAAGQFNYHDGTRPYAVGNLEVVAR